MKLKLQTMENIHRDGANRLEYR